MKRWLFAVIDYLLGFFALALFAAYAFARGEPTEERWVSAFKLGACLAVLELFLLARRKAFANRLIVGANTWLIVGGLAAFTEQWWVLRGYQSFGEASLFTVMLVVGVLTTFTLPGGFVAAAGPRRRVLAASVALLMALAAALLLAVEFRGNIKIAAVAPVVGLSWLNRVLQVYVNGGAHEA